ncbi:hypothetical protein K320107C7_17770 [Alistipes shahii]
MKKRVVLLVALCIWKVVAAQTPYGEMPERFRPDTLPCRLGGGVCFGMDGLDAAIPRGGEPPPAAIPGSCLSPVIR